MHTEALKTLTNIRAIQRLEAYVSCARAALASSPQDRLLSEFIRINEALIHEELDRLIDESSAPHAHHKAA